MATGIVDKLIAKAAREVLSPLGLFQVGASRIWIDDNGWFLTQVEFQPNSWSKGTYLNVGMSFLWAQGEAFSEVLPYNVGCRESGYEEYRDDDELFYRQMLKMAGHAKKKVEEYRRLSKSQMLLNSIDSVSKVRKAWDSGMCHYFQGNEKSGDAQMKLLPVYSLDEREYEFDGKKQTRDWVVGLEKLAELLLSKTGAEKTDYVVQSIIEKRQRLHSRPKYKKLPVDPVFK